MILISYPFSLIKKPQALFLLFLLLLLVPFLSFGDKYYYCRHRAQYKNPSAFDKTFVILKTSSGRVLEETYENYKGMSLFKTFDEGHRILSLYEQKKDRYQKNNMRFFKLLQLTIEDKVMIISYSYQFPIKMFQSLYRIPYTRDSFKRINTSPELLKYFPKKKTKNHLALAYSKHRMKCDSMGYLEFKAKSILLFAVQVMSV